MERIVGARCFGRSQQVWKHRSEVLDCDMNVACTCRRRHWPVKNARCCTGFRLDLYRTKFHHSKRVRNNTAAPALQIIIVAPDTSPRGEGVANDDAYDLGQGAGFYLNATQAPWSAHFRMEDYVVTELPSPRLNSTSPSQTRVVFSVIKDVGGHGALTLALRHPKNVPQRVGVLADCGTEPSALG